MTTTAEETGTTINIIICVGGEWKYVLFYRTGFTTAKMISENFNPDHLENSKVEQVSFSNICVIL